MKFVRNLSVVVTLVVISSLIVEGLASQYLYNTVVGQSNWYGVLRDIVYSIGAVGVVYLGWYCQRLARVITSIASTVSIERPTKTKQKSVVGLNDLPKVINDHLANSVEQINQLQRQVEKLQIQAHIVQRQRKSTEAIIYSLRDAVIVADNCDKLVMANEVAGRILGFDVENSQRKTIDELIDADKSDFVTFLRQSRKSKTEAIRREIEFAFNGQLRVFDCIVSCVYDDIQQFCGVVAVLHDITREKEISQIKNDFVSHVSHELKTPLASIMAYSEMLADGEADNEETRKEFYSIIQGQAKRLNRLIEDILNISRIESGLVKINKEPVSLMILIEEQLQMIRSYAEEKNIEIITPTPIVYDQVYADSDMISQVVVNLLSNAVKYTRSGGSVEIRMEVDSNAGMARVTMTDTGVGIPEDEIDHVFDKFYRVGANQNQAKGTGLGLNLVKQIIEKIHNGRVFVQSQVGVGSTFGFELPLARTERVEAI